VKLFIIEAVSKICHSALDSCHPALDAGSAENSQRGDCGSSPQWQAL